MASRVYEIAVTVPAGTLPSAPQNTPWHTEDNTIEDIEILVPAGHNGFTGVRLNKADVQILPYGMNTWIVANDYSRVFVLGSYTATRDLKIQAYNQGGYPHTFYLRMRMSDFTPGGSGSAVTEDAAIPMDIGGTTVDPLSPDAILGSDTVQMLTDGTITVSEITSGDNTEIQFVQPGPDA